MELGVYAVFWRGTAYEGEEAELDRNTLSAMMCISHLWKKKEEQDKENFRKWLRSYRVSANPVGCSGAKMTCARSLILGRNGLWHPGFGLRFPLKAEAQPKGLWLEAISLLLLSLWLNGELFLEGESEQVLFTSVPLWKAGHNHGVTCNTPLK